MQGDDSRAAALRADPRYAAVIAEQEAVRETALTAVEVINLAAAVDALHARRSRGQVGLPDS